MICVGGGVVRGIFNRLWRSEAGAGRVTPDDEHLDKEKRIVEYAAVLVAVLTIVSYSPLLVLTEVFAIELRGALLSLSSSHKSTYSPQRATVRCVDDDGCQV